MHEILFVKVRCFNGAGLHAENISDETSVVLNVPSDSNAYIRVSEIPNSWYPPIQNYQESNTSLSIIWGGFDRLTGGKFQLSVNDGSRIVYTTEYEEYIDKVFLSDVPLITGHTVQVAVRATNPAGDSGWVSATPLHIGCNGVSLSGGYNLK